MVAGELELTDPIDTAAHARVFDVLVGAAVYGGEAQALQHSELAHL